MTQKIFFSALILVALFGCKKDNKNKPLELAQDTNYTFKVQVKGYWSAKTHPNYHPTGAKFGKVIGITHRDDNVLFREGSRANNWLKKYISTGQTAEFASYFKDYKDSERVGAIIDAKEMSPLDENSFEFKTTSKHHLVSFLMQLSPSPDWFVGKTNINLNGLALGGSASYIVSVFDAGISSADGKDNTNENIQYKKDAPLTVPNGGINKFAIITVKFKKREKIK